MTQRCRERWLILVFNMSKRWRSVLRSVRGEEHLLLRQYFSVATAYCHLHFTLFPYSPRYHFAAPPPKIIRSYYEDSTLSRRIVGMSEADELKDLVRLLTSLWEAAQRLPEGTERQDAFRRIGSFHRRVAALVTGAL
jgi:hypothetical protein